MMEWLSGKSSCEEERDVLYFLTIQTTNERVWEAHMIAYKNPQKKKVKSLVAQSKRETNKAYVMKIYDNGIGN